MSNAVKCPYCGELWDRDFLWTDVEGDSHTDRVQRFGALGCNAFRDGWDLPCGSSAPTPLADFLQAKAKEVQP